MTDHKAEWYLKKNAELTKALLKIRNLTRVDLSGMDWQVAMGKIRKVVEKQNLESGWTPSKVDDKDGSCSDSGSRNPTATGNKE